MWAIFLYVGHIILECGNMLFKTRLDERGRITIPREIREKLGLKPGDHVLVKIQGNSIVITRAEDPFKVIENILGDLAFERSLRYEAEKQAFRELRIRYEDK